MLASKLAQQTCSVVDGWAASNPKALRAMEADGTLLARAKEAQEQAIQAEQRAADEGVTHLSSSEMNEIYGGPSTLLA